MKLKPLSLRHNYGKNDFFTYQLIVKFIWLVVFDFTHNSSKFAVLKKEYNILENGES